MKKTKIIFFLTISLELLLTFTLSFYFHTSFFSLMFFIGLFFLGLALLFSSKGGGLTTFNQATIQAQTGISQSYEKAQVKVGPFLIAAFVYFLIGLAFFILLVNGFVS